MRRDKVKIWRSWNTMLRDVERAFSGGKRVFVRWSRSIRKDLSRGYSVNWANRSREAGLSAVEIEREDLEDPTWFAKVLCSYAILRYGDAKPWVITGESYTRGSDGEPLVDPETVTVVGRPGKRLLERLMAWYDAYVEWQREWDRRKTWPGEYGDSLEWVEAGNPEPEVEDFV